MKNPWRTIIVLCCMACCQPIWAAVDVQIEIHDLLSTDGHVMLALYRQHDNSGWQDEPLLAASVRAADATAGVLHYTLSALEPGRYAIRLFHDQNDNQRIDVGSNGIPQESFAFSGEQMVTGIPTPEQAGFSVPLLQKALVLVLKHPQIQAARPSAP